MFDLAYFLCALALFIVVLALAHYAIVFLYKKPAKALVQDFARDVHEITKPLTDRVYCIGTRLWAFFGPRLTNRALIAMAIIDSASFLGGDVMSTFTTHPRMMIALVIANLLTPLTPNGAPQRIPPPPGPMEAPRPAYP